TLRPCAHMERWELERARQDAYLRRGLGELLAAKVGAEAAVDALVHVQSLAVHVGTRGKCRGLYVGVIAELRRRLAEDRWPMRNPHRRVRVRARAPRLEGISARLDH